jgi:uncharacterized protein YndB with AHSA1/START domain
MPAEKITVATEVPLTASRAWQVYTDPNEIIQWNFANDDWHCPKASADLRVGGKHSARMEAKDASFGFDFEATYTEVDAPRALAMVLGDGRQCRTTFHPSGIGTRVETTFDAETENSIEMQRDGWQAILTNYRKRAEQMAAN